jgi:ubiquinone/menaquinone biosynthesis C-methylase UbiE
MNWIEYWNNNDIDNLPWETYIPDKNLVSFFSSNNIKFKTAIDIGCGLGTNSLWMASQGIKVTGIDISERAIDTAKSNLKNKNLQVDFDVMNFLENNTLSDNYYDLVFDRGCIHGMNYGDIEKFAYEVSRIISPSGLWLSIIGSYDGKEVYCGPPRRTCSEMISFIEPHMKIVNLCSTTMEISNNVTVDAWVLVSKKRILDI